MNDMKARQIRGRELEAGMTVVGFGDAMSNGGAVYRCISITSPYPSMNATERLAIFLVNDGPQWSRQVRDDDVLTILDPEDSRE